MDVDYQVNINLLEEAIRNGVKRFIYISILNGDKLTHLKICKAKAKFVSALKNSGLDYCIVRPTGYERVLSDGKERKDYVIWQRSERNESHSRRNRVSNARTKLNSRTIRRIC